jgi:hypothetical protein
MQKWCADSLDLKPSYEDPTGVPYRTGEGTDSWVYASPLRRDQGQTSSQEAKEGEVISVSDPALLDAFCELFD